MLTETTAQGKWVIYNRETGERMERWPIDARGMIATGSYSPTPVEVTTIATTDSDVPLAELLNRSEGQELEFKSTLRWDVRESKKNPELESAIVKTVAGFLNSESGGTLLIGVDDGGSVVGLEHDYKTLRRQDRDGFENHLTGLLLNALGKDLAPCIRTGFDRLGNGDEVCRVTVRAAPRAVYVPDPKSQEQLYIRTGNSTRPLSVREAVEYCHVRWSRG